MTHSHNSHRDAAPADAAQTASVPADVARAEATAQRVAGTHTLLVACDFDGTLAGLGTDPLHVPVNRRSLQALARLAGLPRTRVVLLSGRNLPELQQVCPLHPPVYRVGGHGAEPENGVPELSAEQRHALDAITEQLDALIERAGARDVFVEHKPFQRVLHFSLAKDPAMIARLEREAHSMDAHGAHVSAGKNIVEFSVSGVTKGSWLTSEVKRLDATATAYCGDDTTDETVFEVQTERDLSVKVGGGPTAARDRVAQAAEIADVLSALADARAQAVAPDLAGDPQARLAAAAGVFAGALARGTDADGRAAYALLTGYAEPDDAAAAWSRFVTAARGGLLDSGLSADVVAAAAARIAPAPEEVVVS